MRYIFNFPDIGEGLEEGVILEWYVKKGQEVKTGDNLVQMETDKVVADIPSPRDGIIVALFGEEGDVAIVGEPLVEIEIVGVHGEEAQKEAKKEVAPLPEEEDFEEEEAAAVVGTMETAGRSAVLAASDEGAEEEPDKKEKPTRKALATPVARAMAKDKGIDINEVKGSGPSGRVMKEDIENFKATKKGAPLKKTVDKGEDVTYEPLTQIRKAISKNMINSKHSAAHMTVFEEVEVSELINVRSRYKDAFAAKDARLTYLPFIVKAVVHALKHHRTVNSQMDLENDRMIYNNRYNIGIAVDTAQGLVVPVIKDADQLSIMEIANQITELAEKANSRKLTMDDMSGGTFTITNYGSIGGIFATPVINYPEAGILGVGRIVKKPVVKNDEVVPGSMLALSLSVDHRIVDGGEASRFINRVMTYLADPVALLMDSK